MNHFLTFSQCSEQILPCLACVNLQLTSAKVWVQSFWANVLKYRSLVNKSYRALVQSQLKQRVKFWDYNTMKDIKLLECSKDVYKDGEESGGQQLRFLRALSPEQRS